MEETFYYTKEQIKSYGQECYKEGVRDKANDFVGSKKDLPKLPKPLQFLSRDKMIEVIEPKFVAFGGLAHGMAAEIVDAILKSGLPENKEHKKCSTHCDWPDCALPGCAAKPLTF